MLKTTDTGRRLNNINQMNKYHYFSKAFKHKQSTRTLKYVFQKQIHVNQHYSTQQAQESLHKCKTFTQHPPQQQIPNCNHIALRNTECNG